MGQPEDGGPTMRGVAGPWHWKDAFRSRRGEFVPEKFVIAGSFPLALGVYLLFADLLFGVGVRGSGFDPVETGYVLAAVAIAFGLLVVGAGIRMHRRGENGTGGPQRTKSK